jgi:gliding motility-associated-like protein
MKLTKYFYFLLSTFCVPLMAHNPIGLEFIENKGQWENNILFKADIRGGAMFLEKDKLTFSIHETRKTHVKNPDPIDKIYKAHAFNMTFLDINPNVEIKPSSSFSNYYNYFIGNDSIKWRGECKAYSEIHYLNIYPNIDLKIASFQGRPKYSFFLKKGARLQDIKIEYNGLESITKDNAGNILSKTSLGYSTDLKPLSYIISNENKFSIPSNFKLEKNQVSFEVDNYKLKENELLEIDPEIIFSTYSGSTADNFGATATYDFFGNLYGSGLVFGTGYPTTLGAFQSTFAGQTDIAITKFNATGSARIYSTYIGGSSYDVPHSLIVDQNSRLILLGTTSSLNYPTTSNAFDKTFNGGDPLNMNVYNFFLGLGIEYPNGADIVITKFNASGGGLIGSTYFGGSGTDGVGTASSLIVNYGDCLRGEILVDSTDQVYIATTSNSTNLTFLNKSLYKTNSGGFDGIIAKFNTNLSNLISFSHVGGSGDDALYDMAFDNNNNIIAAGGSNSLNFPSTAGAFATTNMGGVDGIITSFDNNLSLLRFSGYYGTADYDQIYFVELNNNDEIHVFGQSNTNTGNFYSSNALFGQANSGQFISIFNPLYTSRLRSTMFGDNDSIPDISPTAFLVDYCDKIFITGWGSNLGGFNTYRLSVAGLPVTSNAYQSSTLGNGFYMMILEGNLSQLFYGSFFGGTTALSDEHVDGGTSRFDKNGIIYHAVCAGCGGENNYPIFPSASAVVAGTNSSPNCNLGVLKFDFGLPVNANFSSSTNCAPGNIQFTDLSHTVGSNVTYKWDFGNGNTSSVKNPTAFYNTPGVYQVKLIVIDPMSCNITDTIIKPVLVLGYSSSTLPDKSICVGNSVRIGFPNVSDPSITINWTPSSTIDDPNILAPYASPTSTTIYKAIVSKGSCIDTFFQKVSITNDLIKTKADSIICPNDTVSIQTTEMKGATYFWSPSSIIINDTGAKAIAKIPSSSMIYVKVIDTNNCEFIDSVFINVLDKNTFFIKTMDSLNCKFDSLEIETSYLPNVQYNWTPTTPINSGLGTNKIKGFINTNTLFIVTASIARGCSITDSLFLKKDSSFVKISADSLICKLDTFTIIATANPNYKYSWSPTNWVENRDTLVRYVMRDKLQYRCEITVTPGNKCKYFDTITLDYNRLLDDLEAIANPTRIEFGDSSRLDAKTQHGIDFLWSPKETLDKNFVPSPWAKPKISTIYEVIVTDRNGCKKSDTAEVEVYYEICEDPEVYVPNAFTPNSDGKNDAIYVRGDNIVRLYFAIYDRWGQLIFQTNTQKKGWDGTFKGIMLEPAVYAYYLDVECIGGARLKKSGNITLLK